MGARIITHEDYLALEDKAECKSEFFNGEIYATAGRTAAHARLSARIAGMLDRALPSCQVFTSDLKLYIEAFNQSFYPDAMAVCGAEPALWKTRKDVILNPTVVVEVLSLSTEKYDKEIKALYYRSIPSLQHILCSHKICGW